MYVLRLGIGNDAISLSKEFFGKNGSKLAQRSTTNSHADVTKINKLKMFFRINRRSLKYAPKEFSKVNACARGPPWCYKNIQYSRQRRSVTHANPEWYVLTVSQRRCARLIFKQRCHVTTSSWIKILSTLVSELVSTVVTWYTNRCIPFYISDPNKEINFFIFVELLLILSFHSLTLVLYNRYWQHGHRGPFVRYQYFYLFFKYEKNVGRKKAQQHTEIPINTR